MVRAEDLRKIEVDENGNNILIENGKNKKFNKMKRDRNSLLTKMDKHRLYKVFYLIIIK